MLEGVFARVQRKEADVDYILLNMLHQFQHAAMLSEQEVTEE